MVRKELGLILEEGRTKKQGNPALEIALLLPKVVGLSINQTLSLLLAYYRKLIIILCPTQLIMPVRKCSQIDHS